MIGTYQKYIKTPSQIWDNLSIKNIKVVDYNSLKKAEIHESY